MSFVIEGLSPGMFNAYRGKSESGLAALNARRVVADEANAFPCRISLTDAQPGETLILLNFEHLPAASPYRSRHAIYINEAATAAARFVDTVPAQLERRLLSVRAFDARWTMVDAEVVEGSALRSLIERFFAQADVDCIHVHNARRGCYAARVCRT
jgi:hypothetical protein